MYHICQFTINCRKLNFAKRIITWCNENRAKATKGNFLD